MTPAITPATRAALEAQARETLDAMLTNAPPESYLHEALFSQRSMIRQTILAALLAAHAESYEAGRKETVEEACEVLLRQSRDFPRLRPLSVKTRRLLRALATPTPETKGVK